ncbi:hypothetical protein [Streptomyces flavofungini]|uniref:Gram-positive cocci surface proteins LPxTG domain-containing protein n=1 Tax=Streptomyces flavofungini TaxID=68200 RepID=A0ABS0X970_9ACTN|nr:hypothetical protein [Streptomyces flavofungini]MBJ3809756.1 hypothetical protein [Streptomyces flavofungini]
MGALAATTGQAAAAPRPIGQCTTRSGAVLAVDFSDWGGPILRSCGTTPTTGYELLNQGGWRTTGTGHDGPAFICRIGYSGYKGGKQFPTPAQDDCVLTPPATAYWSYWHADAGSNTWQYSQLGAMLYKPKPGSVDLWIFGGTNIEGTKGRPTVSPDQLRARNTRPTGGKARTPQETKTAKPLPPGVDTGPAPERPVTEKPAPKPKKPKAEPKPRHSTSPSPSATKKPSPAASSGAGEAKAAPGPSAKVVNAAPAADAAHDTGSYVPAALTGALVLLVGGAGAYAARRRRRTE